MINDNQMCTGWCQSVMRVLWRGVLRGEQDWSTESVTNSSASTISWTLPPPHSVIINTISDHIHLTMFLILSMCLVSFVSSAEDADFADNLASCAATEHINFCLTQVPQTFLTYLYYSVLLMLTYLVDTFMRIFLIKIDTSGNCVCRSSLE